MKGCLNFDCPNTSSLVTKSEEGYCEDCGKELQPWPACRCGRALDLKWLRTRLLRGTPTYCGRCGSTLDEAALGPLLAENLLELVRQVTQARNATKTN